MKSSYYWSESTGATVSVPDCEEGSGIVLWLLNSESLGSSFLIRKAGIPYLLDFDDCEQVEESLFSRFWLLKNASIPA